VAAWLALKEMTGRLVRTESNGNRKELERPQDTKWRAWLLWTLGRLPPLFSHPPWVSGTSVKWYEEGGWQVASESCVPTTISIF
jgi:hypothetical protein